MMNNMFDILGSIVAFKNDKTVLDRAIASFLQANLNVYLYVIDNSPSDDLREVCSRKNVEYIFNNKNLGFGAGHNIAIRKTINKTKYVLILNPDVNFKQGVLETVFHFMEKNQDAGLTMPKVLYPDGSLQYLCRLLPNPFDLLLRKFNNKVLDSWNNSLTKYELRFADYAKIMEVPYLSGCFMFMRADVLKRVGMFDERFFVYFEDIDLSRRIHNLYRTVYYPEAVICHNYERGANRDITCLKYLISSGIKYFNKWGWFLDKERKSINRRTIRNLAKVPTD